MNEKQLSENSAGLNAAIGAAVRRIRKANGWRLLDVAERSGGAFKQAHLGQLEKGERTWNAPGLEAVARALGVSPAQLLDDAQPWRRGGTISIVLSDVELQVVHALRRHGWAGLSDMVMRELISLAGHEAHADPGRPKQAAVPDDELTVAERQRQTDEAMRTGRLRSWLRQDLEAEQK